MDNDPHLIPGASNTLVEDLPPGMKRRNKAAEIKATKKRIIDSIAGGPTRAPHDKAAKFSCLAAIIHLHEYILTYDTGYSTDNLHHSCLLTAVVWNIVTKIRQTGNKGEGKTKDLIDKITLEKYILEGEAFNNVVNTSVLIMKLYGIDFEIKANPKNGTFMSLLALIHCFKYALDEIRLVNNAIKTGKDGDSEKYTLAKSYQVTGDHYYQLKGINYPPILAGSLTASLGVATVMVKLAQTSAKYSQKWKKALCNSFSQIPAIEGIAEQMSGKDVDAGPIIQRLCKISDFGVSKQGHKAKFPYFFLRKNLNMTDLESWIQLIKAVPTTMLPDVSLPTMKHMDFSGHGAYGLYNHAAKYDYVFPGSVTAPHAQQCCFMAVFGMESEDMAIGEYMTGMNFVHRTEMGEELQKAGTAAGVRFNPVRVKYASKLASAAVSNILPRGTVQTHRSKTMAGKVRVVYTENDLRKLDAGNDEIYSVVSSLYSAGKYLDKYMLLMRQELAKTNELIQGTTSWFAIDDSKEGAAYGEEQVGKIIDATKRFYFNAPKAVEAEEGM